MSINDEKLTTHVGDATKTVRFGLRTQSSLAGYSCKITVTDLNEIATTINGATISGTVTVGSKEYFAVALTGGQTSSIGEGKYILYMRISGPTGPFTDSIDLDVLPQIVPD